MKGFCPSGTGCGIFFDSAGFLVFYGSEKIGETKIHITFDFKLLILMNTDFSVHDKKPGNVSETVVNNNKKLRIGIMLNGPRLEAWQANMLEAISGSDYASLELGIINKARNHTATGSNRNILLYNAYTGLENRIVKNYPDAFALKDASRFLKNVPKIEIQPRSDTSTDVIDEEDVKKIKAFSLDVIIQCGFRTLKGNILDAAKCGIWSYHHCDDIRVKGGPPGFWETFERMRERGVILQMLTRDPEGGIVLYRSSFGTDSLFVKKNNNGCYLRSATFVPRTLKKLYTLGEKDFFESVQQENKKFNFYNYPMYTTPTNLPFLPLLIKHFYRMGVQGIRHQFFENQWVLLYDLSDTVSTSFWRFKKIVPPRDRFWADPHVFFRDDIYYIFFEEYLLKKKIGHISLIEMQQSGEYSKPVVVLKEPFHLSYPQVFEHNGTLFMIPETQSAYRINLYECTGFPTEWKLKKTLIDSVEAADSTILFHKNKWWLFTSIGEPKGTTDYKELYLYYSDNLLSDTWNSHPLNPIVSDIRIARPGGKIIQENDRLYRPSQCCIGGYGYGINFNEIVTLTENDYQERDIGFIEPLWDRKLKGVHTFCHEDRLTLIDGYYQKFFI
jgi:hypothetical protein